MHLHNSARGYGAISLSLLWLVAGLVVLAWLLGTFRDDLPEGAARAVALYVHISSWLREMREPLASLLMLAAGLHAFAALMHQFLRHGRTLARVLPDATL